MDAAETCAVIAAAGLSSRMGDFKPLLPIGSVSIVRRVIGSLQSAGIKRILLVTGYRGEELELHVQDLGVVCLRNPAYRDTQMFDSIRIGLAAVAGSCSRILFSPVDVPLFSADTVRRLLATEADLAVPVSGGRRGHPVMISASLIPPLLADGGEGGMRGALTRAGAAETLVECPDAGMLRDADTPEDYRALLRYYEKENKREK
jgi:CTP:molybdopterin cytidylyltransferase MocA